MSESQSIDLVEPLFNAAFCATLAFRATRGYHVKTRKPIPVAYLYLIIPSALHKATREALPRTTTSSMLGWLRENPLVLMDFETRVHNLMTRISAGISFALEHGVLANVEGDLEGRVMARRPRMLKPTYDWESCMKSSEFLGKWFGVSGSDQATVLAGWGFRP